MWAVVLLATAGAAEITDSLDAGERRILATVAMQPEITLGVGYAQGIAVAGHDVTFGAHLAVPLFLLDGRHQRVEAFARSEVVGWRSLQLHARVALFEQTAHTALFDGLTLGFGTGLLPGVYRPDGYIALEVSLDVNLTTYLAPSALYRDTHWADAARGWVAPSGGLQFVGLQGGVTVADRVDLGLRLGVDETLKGGRRTAPLYVGLGVHTHL